MNSFRTAQAVSDLVHHVKPLLAMHLAVVAVASGLTLAQTGEAFRALRDDGFQFRRDEVLPLLDGLQKLAMARAEGFELAVVVLLADALLARAPSGLLADAWAEAEQRLRDWPATLRAAVANGLVRAVEQSVILLDRLPARRDCLTFSEPEVSETLLRVARAMHRHELEAIALADDGMHVEAYFDALIETLARFEGIFPKQGLSPLKVVDLTSFDTKSSAFAGCTAILLLNAVKLGFDDGLHWQNYGAAYCALKPSQRNALLAGYRYIYEFDQHFSVEVAGRLGIGATIPVVDDL